MPAPRKYRRPRRPPPVTTDDTPTSKKWLITLVILSLLLHVCVMLAFIFIGRHTPKWPEQAKEDKPPEVSLVLSQPPPPMKPDFIPTEPDPNAPHVQSPMISDNDSALKSVNRVARQADTPLPDVTGKKQGFDLHTKAPSPLSKPQPATPPTPPQKQQPKEQKKNVAKPNDATKPEPPDPDALKPTDEPDRTTGTVPTKDKPVQQQYDPNGLPVLPPIAAPTIAPQAPETTPIEQPQHKASPASVPSFAVYQSDVSGSIGQSGNNSAAAMATDLGRYKAKVYRAVGSRWYSKVQSQLQVLGVGTVHITYTIYSDGRLEIRSDPDSGNPSLMLLHSISLNSMTEAAPFDPFSDKMKKEVGDSYTDDFSFSIYGD